MTRIVWSIVLLGCVTPVCGQQQQEGLQLTLPPEVLAVTHVPTNVYFDNIVLTQSVENYRFEVTCDVGRAVDRRWTFLPTDQDVGNHPIRIAVYGLDNNLLESKPSVLRVVANDNQRTRRPIRLLFIGDSLTHASKYPNEIARLLSERKLPKWKMLGTHRPVAAATGVAHEGYGGWTWARFVTKYEANPDGTHKKRSSPFVFAKDESSPQLDMHQYFQDACDGQLPDYVVIMLGINDCFSAPPDDFAEIDTRIDRMFTSADRLLAAIRAAAPKAQIGVCLTTPPNSRQAAFEANYKDRYTRWGWKRIQHRLVQRQIQYIAKKSDPQISIVPTQLNLDPIDGYPANNGVHPNESGYKQIGATIYSWLKWRMTKTPSETY